MNCKSFVTLTICALVSSALAQTAGPNNIYSGNAVKTITDSTGNLFILIKDGLSYTINRIDQKGTKAWSKSFSVPGYTQTDLNFGRDGTLVVTGRTADSMAFSIRRFNRVSGAIVSSAQTAVPFPVSQVSPYGDVLAMSSAGLNLYFPNNGALHYSLSLQSHCRQILGYATRTQIILAQAVLGSNFDGGHHIEVWSEGYNLSTGMRMYSNKLLQVDSAPEENSHIYLSTLNRLSGGRTLLSYIFGDTVSNVIGTTDTFHVISESTGEGLATDSLAQSYDHTQPDSVGTYQFIAAGGSAVRIDHNHIDKAGQDQTIAFNLLNATDTVVPLPIPEIHDNGSNKTVYEAGDGSILLQTDDIDLDDLLWIKQDGSIAFTKQFTKMVDAVPETQHGVYALDKIFNPLPKTSLYRLNQNGTTTPQQILAVPSGDYTLDKSWIEIGADQQLFVVQNFTIPGGSRCFATSFLTAPLGKADYYITNKNTPITVGAPGVLANDIDQDGDPLSAQLYQVPSASAGTVSNFSPSGSFKFTPAPGFTGNADFYYRNRDSHGRYGNSTLIRVTVRP